MENNIIYIILILIQYCYIYNYNININIYTINSLNGLNFSNATSISTAIYNPAIYHLEINIISEVSYYWFFSAFLYFQIEPKQKFTLSIKYHNRI